MFIVLSDVRINPDDISRYKRQDSPYGDHMGGTVITFRDGELLFVKESVDLVDTFMRESYITVKEIK